MNEQKRPTSSVAALAFFSIFWGIMAFIIYSGITRDYIGGLFLGFFYALLHPLIGKLFTLSSLGLCNLFDTIYKPNRNWGNWGLRVQLNFACFWPIVGFPTVLFLLIVVIIGLLYSRLFTEKQK